MGGKNVLELPRAVSFLNIRKIIAITKIIHCCQFSINFENDKYREGIDQFGSELPG